MMSTVSIVMAQEHSFRPNQTALWCQRTIEEARRLREEAERLRAKSQEVKRQIERVRHNTAPTIPGLRSGILFNFAQGSRFFFWWDRGRAFARPGAP
jgi:hypothetical protein